MSGTLLMEDWVGDEACTTPATTDDISTPQRLCDDNTVFRCVNTAS